MIGEHSVAIVGGGPAGALAGAILAGGGKKVILFDEKLAWEKPCGGGLTYKVLRQYPFLADAGGTSNRIENCELISPSGRWVVLRLQYPVTVFSRFALNGLLLERARQAGVDIRQERVTQITEDAQGWRLISPQGNYRAGFAMLAAGARNSFRGQFLTPFAASDLMVTAGYFIPCRTSLMQIQFLKEISGYIWIFPRADHVSAGIAAKMGERPTGGLRSILEDWLERSGFRLQSATFYSHILPALNPESLESLTVCGDDWAMVGDSAGLVDPITGEGLYYALRSAEMCANAILRGRPAEYQTELEAEVLPELKLAARLAQRFYRGQIFGDSVLERMVGLTEKSESFRQLMSDLFAGVQGYCDLRARLNRILPAVMAEGLSGTWRQAWGSTGGVSKVPPGALFE